MPSQQRRATAEARPAVALFVQRFPEVSQTFVMDHATGLMDLGHAVRILALGQGSSPIRHADHAAYGLAACTHYEAAPPPPETLRHPRRLLLRALAQTAPTRWPALSRTLDQDRYGADARYLRLLFHARAVLDAPRFDIAHFHFANHAQRYAALRQCGVLRTPCVVSVHGYDVNRPLREGRRPYSLVFRFADRVVASTRFMAAQTEALGCPADRIRVIPVPVRLREFPYRARSLEADAPVRLLTVARLVEVKGVEFALHAVQRLRERGADVRYTIVGDGPLRSALQSLANRLGLGDRVTFAGALGREQVREHLERSHLFLLTSVRLEDGDCEGQGLVLQEAQASGLPVVATRTGGVPEGVSDAALLVPERDVTATALALESLIARAAEWPAIGAVGRGYVEQRFDLGAVSARHSSLYEELLGRPG